MKNCTKILILLLIALACSTSTDDIDDESDSPNPNLDEFTDQRDGKTYKIVQVGNQIWMAENLAYLPQVSAAANGPTYENYEQFENQQFYYVYGYNDNLTSDAKTTDNYKTCGALYDWNAARNACPDGWHLPTKQEWETLADYISENHGSYSKQTYERGEIAWEQVGGHLKSSSNWNNSGNGTDDYDLKCIAGGFRNNDGNFYGRGNACRFWTSSASNNQPNEKFGVALNDYSQTLELLLAQGIDGFSVRCIKD